MTQTEKMFVAHRGESYDAPENTLAAVNLAWQRGVKAVEVDVHFTADNEICVIHDNDTLRTTGKKLIVSESSIEELQVLDAGSWKGEKWAGKKIPNLKEVLASVPPHAKLVIEIKSDYTMLEKLAEIIKGSGTRDIEIIAFNLQTLARAKQMMPQFKMLWLIMSKPTLKQFLTGTLPAALIKKLKKYSIDGVNVGDSRYLTRKFIEKFTSAGFLVYTWTVNDPERALNLLKSGVNCITTDRAAWMEEMLKDRV